MLCPVCQTRSLVASTLESGLQALGCDSCGGSWINSFQFWRWQEERRQTPATVHAPAPPPPALVEEPKGAKLCPECGRILGRYRVDRSLPFRLERCGHCGGLWFDKNEWETLRSLQFLDEVHLIFSSLWQNRLRREVQASQQEELFRARLGESDYAEARRVQCWLAQHPHRAEILAYVQRAEDWGATPRAGEGTR